MTGSSSKLLQIEGKWYRERKAQKIQNLRQKKIQKLFYTHLINLRLFSVFVVWCVHVASLYDSTLRFLVAARPDSAPWLSTTNPWDDSWGSSLEGFSLAQSNLKQSGRSALQLKSYHGKYFTVLEACHGFSPCHSSVKSLVTVKPQAQRLDLWPVFIELHELDSTRRGQATGMWLTLIPKSALARGSPVAAKLRC